MKQTLLVFLLASLSLFSYAQFELSPKSFVDKQKSENEYLVLNFEGKTKQDLFKSSMVYLNKFYNSPKDVISTVEDETITVNAISNAGIRRTGMHKFEMNYTLTFEFKDEKVKVNAPSFMLTSFAAGHKQTMDLVLSGFSMDGSYFGIYNKKGELKYDKAKEDLENFFNNYIESYKAALFAKSDW